MEPPSATILLHRRPNVVQPLWVYTVEVDDRVAAHLVFAQREAVEVPVGRHSVQAKVLWWSSRVLPVELGAGESVTVEIAPDVRHLWNMAVRPSRFLRIDVARDRKVV